MQLLSSLLVQNPTFHQRSFLLAETFQALADSSRIQIIWILTEQTRNVTEIATLLNMSQPTVSHHLRTLRNLKLVKVQKKGRSSYYSLDDIHIEKLLIEGVHHVNEIINPPSHYAAS